MLAGMLFMLFSGVWSTPLAAEQQMSRDDYVAQFHEDLLGPCKNSSFVACLGTSEAECLSQVNELVAQCTGKLPEIITEKNFDNAADDYASCVFDSLQQAFGKTSEQIGQCENRAGLR